MVPNEYIAALMNIKPFSVYEITPEGLREYLRVTGESVIPAVAISEHDLAGQAERVSAEIAWWSRLHAQAERAAHYCEREYAAWKSKFRLAHVGEVLESTGKKPTAAQLDDLYRVDPEYAQHNSRLEETREAATACKGVLDAFKAKRDIISRELYRANDGSLQRIAG